MSNFADWLVKLVKDFLTALWDLLVDLAVALLDLLLTAILVLINALPLPSFLTSGGLQALVNAVPSDIWYFASRFKLGECLAMFGAAVVFRLVRKAITLFQW